MSLIGFKTIETGVNLSIVDIEKLILCVLKKVHDYTKSSIVLHEAVIQIWKVQCIVKNVSNFQKSDTFHYENKSTKLE